MVLSNTPPAYHSPAPTPAAAQPASTTVREHHQAALTHLLVRLARLVQEMGDRGLEPEAYTPVPELRTTYLRLSAEAVRLIERLGQAPSNPGDHLTSLLVAQLRRSTRAERRGNMSLQQALGETLLGG